MIKKIRKTFFVWQSGKEKTWLEEMAKQGYILKNVTFMSYHFDISEPTDLVYEFDFQILNRKTEPEYLEIFDDWKLITKSGAWYYFSKQREGNEKDLIYCDKKSKSEMFKKVIIFLLIVGFPLYYQLLIMYPNMNPEKLVFPKFYFFFRIIVIIFTILHTYALINVLLIYRSLKKSIKE